MQEGAVDEVMGGWLPIIAHVELVPAPVVTQIAVRGKSAPQWQPRLTLPGTEEGLELQPGKPAVPPGHQQNSESGFRLQ
jgi:hypothetical protein